MLKRAQSIFRCSKLLRVFEAFQAHVGNRRYDALADPDEVIWISPSDVTRYSEFWTKELRDNPVLGGFWDRTAKRIDAHPIYQGLEEHFEYGIEWNDARMFQTRAFVYLKRSETVAEKLRQRDALYESIRKRGVLPNFSPSTPELGKYNDGDVKNIAVLIGRSGEAIFACRGWHRLCIAKILRVPKIPVQVLLRHSKWQKIREELANVTSSAQLSPRARRFLGHPDLKDVIPSMLANFFSNNAS
jgi:hypothetical protein